MSASPVQSWKQPHKIAKFKCLIIRKWCVIYLTWCKTDIQIYVKHIPSTNDSNLNRMMWKLFFFFKNPIEITWWLVWEGQEDMNHTVVWPLTCKGQLDVHPWVNKPHFLRMELVSPSAQTSRTVILILDVLTLSDKYQSDSDKGNESASTEVMWTYSDHPQGCRFLTRTQLTAALQPGCKHFVLSGLH